MSKVYKHLSNEIWLRIVEVVEFPFSLTYIIWTIFWADKIQLELKKDPVKVVVPFEIDPCNRGKLCLFMFTPLSSAHLFHPLLTGLQIWFSNLAEILSSIYREHNHNIIVAIGSLGSENADVTFFFQSRNSLTKSSLDKWDDVVCLRRSFLHLRRVLKIFCMQLMNLDRVQCNLMLF